METVRSTTQLALLTIRTVSKHVRNSISHCLLPLRLIYLKFRYYAGRIGMRVPLLHNPLPHLK
jgi:hypothetical protein